jgi:palmitoyl-protein thioesterase
MRIFRRALVQRCPTVKVKNLISLGGQHQGVYGLPNCGSLSNTLCDYVRRLLNHAAYLEYVFIQDVFEIEAFLVTRDTIHYS